MRNTQYLILCCLTLSIISCTEKQPVQPPNIIFILADDLGYGHLGCYGQEKIFTPYIDALANAGMKFTQSYAGAPVCALSRSILMTGYHAGHTSVRANGGGTSLQESDITLAQILKKNGYVTGLFGKWGLGDEGSVGIPNNKGFDEFFGYLHQLHAQFYYPEFLWHNQEKVLFPENENFGRKTYSHDLILEKSLEFIKKNQDTTFFCYLPVAIPHHEFIVPDESLEMYKGKFPEEPIDFWRENYALPQEPKATFAAMITHLDKGVGQIMALLKELGLEENTLIIFTSDNGPAAGPLENPDFFNARGGLRGEKFSLYEGGIRVPFIASWPDHIQKGATNDLPFYFTDMVPTLAEITETSSFSPNDLDGISILPTLLGKGEQEKHSFLYWEVADYDRTPPYQMQPASFMQAVRKENWKAVKNSPNDNIELYNLEEDLTESKNVASQYPDLVTEMKEIMQLNHQPAPSQKDITYEEAADLYIPGHSKSENIHN